MKILIIKNGALGDVVRTSYILSALYEKYDKPEIFWKTQKSAVDLINGNIIPINIFTDYADFLFIDFDLIISLDDEIEELTAIKNLRHKSLFGAYLDSTSNLPCYTEDSSLWYDMGLLSRFGKEKADRLKKLNSLDHSKIFQNMLGLSKITPHYFGSIDCSLTLSCPQGGRAIGINPFAGKRWPSKEMPLNELIELVKNLLSVDMKNHIYLFAGLEHMEKLSWLHEFEPSSRVNFVETNNSLPKLAAAIKQLDLLITSDSLALHLAIANGVKYCAFFTSTSAAEINNTSNSIKIISKSSDYCSYDPNADNSTITSKRIMQSIVDMVSNA